MLDLPGFKAESGILYNPNTRHKIGEPPIGEINLKIFLDKTRFLLTRARAKTRIVKDLIFLPCQCT